MARYNYIFSTSRPSGDKYKGMVYVPETGQTYRNTAEAARALGVDASNISKVLKGKRKTAGGYHFEKTTEADAKRRKFLQDVKNSIKEANDIIKKARKDQRENFVDEVADLDDFGGDVIGSTQDNLIDDSSETLDDMDADELEQLEKKLREKIDAAEKGLDKANDRLQEYADLFGISSPEMAKYEPLIPDINRTLDRARDKNGLGSDVYEFIRDQIQNNVDPDALRDLLDKINNYLDNPERGKSLYDVLDAWQYREYRGQSWEDIMNDKTGRGWK